MQGDADETDAGGSADADDAASENAAAESAVEADAADVTADEADASEESVDEADASEESVDEADASEGDAVEGVDTEHVMNLTFVLTLVFGVPTVVVLSLFVPLDGWSEIIGFVVRVGAAIWFLTAVSLYVRERIRE